MRCLILSFALGLSACDPAPNAQSQPPSMPEVTVSPPLVKPVVEYDEFTGQFDAVERVEVRARVSGYLQEIRFEDGQMVQAGDLLFVIDQRPFQIDLDAAQADLQQAQAQLDLAERELTRAEELRGRGNISQAEVDRRLEELRAARGQVQSAQANVDDAELNLAFTTVTAPISGRVGRKRITPGNLVDGTTAGATVLTTLVKQDPIYFYFDVSESELLKYVRLNRAGERISARDMQLPISIKLLDEEAFEHHGVIDFVDNALAEASGTLEVRAVLDNADGLLLPGQFGRLRLAVRGETPRDALLIPDESVLADQARRYVLTVDADGVVGRQFIEPGPIIDGLRLVRSGLERDQRIVVAGVQRARPGARVKAVDGTITANGTAGSGQ